jgi:hypothetical protein
MHLPRIWSADSRTRTLRHAEVLILERDRSIQERPGVAFRLPVQAENWAPSTHRRGGGMSTTAAEQTSTRR